MNCFIRPTAAIATSLALVLSAMSPAAHAHGGAKAQHGGVVQMASDLSFELVAQGTGSALYVVDHDKPADAGKFSGKLTVLQGADKSEAELKPAGGNKLEAAVKLEKGAKAVATVQLPNGTSTTVRFSIK
jgi:hypothetical protein